MLNDSNTHEHTKINDRCKEGCLSNATTIMTKTCGYHFLCNLGNVTKIILHRVSRLSHIHKKHPLVGYRSIVSMAGKTRPDQIKSAKVITKLQDRRGAPGSQFIRCLWIDRLERYLEQSKVS
jgi:hypothetical protein